MPIATSPKTASHAPGDPVDVRTLDHLHAHPEVASLLQKQHALRARLTAVESAIRAQRQAIAALEAGEVINAADLAAAWQPSSTLQEARQRLTVLVDEQHTLQEAQPYVNHQVEEVKTAVQQALLPEVQVLGQPVMERYVRAMEELHGAQGAAQAFATWAYRLVGTHMIPLGLVQDPTLTARLKYVRDTVRAQFTWTESQ